MLRTVKGLRPISTVPDSTSLGTSVSTNLQTNLLLANNSFQLMLFFFLNSMKNKVICICIKRDEVLKHLTS